MNPSLFADVIKVRLQLAQNSAAGGAKPLGMVGGSNASESNAADSGESG